MPGESIQSANIVLYDDNCFQVHCLQIKSHAIYIGTHKYKFKSLLIAL